MPQSPTLRMMSSVPPPHSEDVTSTKETSLDERVSAYLASDSDASSSLDAHELIIRVEAAHDHNNPIGLVDYLLPSTRPVTPDGGVNFAMAALDAVIRSQRDAGDESGAERALNVQRRLVANLVHRSREAASMGAGGQSGHTTSISITMHELRRPLTIMSSYGQLLASGALGDLPENAMLAVDNIMASVDMMVRLVNSLAEISRLEDPDDLLVVEDLPIPELLAGALEHVGMEVQLHDTRVETEFPKEELLVRGDRRKLVLALTNLLSNAVKHTPTGASVKVAAVRKDGVIFISVGDRGPGLGREDPGHLFDKYYRSQEEKQRGLPGTGLGLYIVRTIMERHGGGVDAHPREGGGAEFELHLPASPPK